MLLPAPNGANICMCDKFGFNVLVYVSKSGQGNIKMKKMVQLSLCNGANVDLWKNDGRKKFSSCKADMTVLFVFCCNIKRMSI